MVSPADRALLAVADVVVLDDPTDTAPSPVTDVPFRWILRVNVPPLQEHVHERIVQLVHCDASSTTDVPATTGVLLSQSMIH
jgi:hypothetical protein